MASAPVPAIARRMDQAMDDADEDQEDDEDEAMAALAIMTNSMAPFAGYVEGSVFVREAIPNIEGMEGIQMPILTEIGS